MRNEYTTTAKLDRLVTQLSDRDRAILLDLARVRVLTGAQLTRLHFADLSVPSRERARRRVLARLGEHRLVATLERPIGGVRAGSAGHVHSLGIAGVQALPLLGVPNGADEGGGRVRTPRTPGHLFLSHGLAVAELYVQLLEAERASKLMLTQFLAEPATWHPDGRGGVIKPDAYVRVQASDLEDAYWVEVDLATESIPTLRRKLLAYLEFALSGGVGPDGIMPRVIVTVPHDRRLAAVRDLVEALPVPAAELISVVLHDQAVASMIDTLRSEP